MASGASQSLAVRVFAPDDWAKLRDVRLAALRDSPRAFYSTYEEALAQDESFWRGWPRRGVAFGVWLRDQPVGMVGVALEESAPTAADLFAMWVAPAARGSGAADALVRAAIVWAVGQGCAGVSLEVAGGNERAERLYARHGFVQSGESTLVECGVVMRRDLTDAGIGQR